jgi:ABC-2 type transport system ATP-binding protein
MAIIQTSQLCKTYRTAIKSPGLLGTLRHFVNRNYRQVDAVRGVDLSIEPGEIVGFLGPNGAGKTTTLKMLTGLIHPSAGHAHVAGYVPFERRREFLKRITLVMGQKQQLIWDLPTAESLKINTAVYEISEDTARSRIAELSEMLGITRLLDQPVRKLSLGERMKCELLAALLHQPEVLFLDEPTLGLDITAQDAIRRFLKDYNIRHRATVILSSHYMADITALCQRVVLIHQGAIMYDGALDAITARFAPYREVDLQLSAPVSSEQLARYGEVASLEGRHARLIVKREHLTRTVQQLFSELELDDLSVKDPPVEQVIGKLYQAGHLGTAELNGT